MNKQNLNEIKSMVGNYIESPIYKDFTVDILEYRNKKDTVVDYIPVTTPFEIIDEDINCIVSTYGLNNDVGVDVVSIYNIYHSRIRFIINNIINSYIYSLGHILEIQTDLHPETIYLVKGNVYDALYCKGDFIDTLCTEMSNIVKVILSQASINNDQFISNTTLFVDSAVAAIYTITQECIVEFTNCKGSPITMSELLSNVTSLMPGLHDSLLCVIEFIINKILMTLNLY